MTELRCVYGHRESEHWQDGRYSCPADYELSREERVAVWLTVHAPELREPYGLAHALLADDGPLK